jgi:vitamin B12/bleomycin/antimicrobial peptide transport system ATP-binding/permease protein
VGSSSIDWANELLNSALWIVGVFVATLLGSALVGWLLLRSTVWGRQFRRLAGDYFTPSRAPGGWGPLLLALGILFMTVAGVRLSVLFTYWGNDMLTSLQQGDAPFFWGTMLLFVPLAGIWIVYQLLNLYVTQVLTIKWRIFTNSRVIDDWMSGEAYHRGNYVKQRVDNPDQRIQEDVYSFVGTSIALVVGAIGSMVSLVSFTLILWELSGPIPIFGIEIPRAMTFIAYLYVIIASVFAFRIGRPLIRLNFLNEALTGTFRYALVRLRDASENVAFYRGGRVERANLDSRFAAVIGNSWDLLHRNIKFSGTNFVFTQAAVVLPYLIQGPRVLTGSLTLGDFNQTAQAFGEVSDALSFFRNTYDTFADYRAVLNRLTGLLDADAEARAMPSVDIEEGTGLEVHDLTVRKPDAELLMDDLNLALTAGDTMLIKGPSGSGKTTLLRSMAGLWPYADGTVRRPVGGGSLFLSQQPYVPLGPLRTALAYPEPPEAIDDDQAREMLRKVQLAHLVDHLDEEVDWSRRLSPGEQQRLGFARILISRPQLVFLDEATSSVDEGLEYMLYDLVRTELPDTIVVSVSHRSTLGDFHSGELELLGAGRWTASGISSLTR